VKRETDDGRREALLELVVDYVTAHGLVGLSLRPLADAVGSSPRVLLYYFGSKDELIALVLRRLRERQAAALRELPRNARTYRETIIGAWRILSDPKYEKLSRTFFEIYGVALQAPERYGEFVCQSVLDWIAFSTAGGKNAAFATLLLAGFRGFLLDLWATGDRERVDAAVDLWVRALDHLPDEETT
jgi:AcrR family transcriptional regulator